jgi:hypothetical protein
MDDTSDLSKQPALRNWQSKVYDKGPYQILITKTSLQSCRSMSKMAAHIERLTEKVEDKTKINQEWKAACDAAVRSDSWWVY